MTPRKSVALALFVTVAGLPSRGTADDRALRGVPGARNSGATEHVARPAAEAHPVAEAYATTLGGDQTSYLPGLQALATSIRALDSSRPIFVMINRPPVPELASVAECLDLTVVQMPDIPRPASARNWFEPRFGGTWFKLSAWALPVQRLIFLDGDTVVLRGLDRMFASGCALMGAADCGLPCVTSTFNSGVIGIQPSMATFRDMLAKLDILYGYDGGDQGFLESYFGDGWRAQDECQLPQSFNKLHRREGMDDFHMDDLYVLHMTGSKPWATPASEYCYPESYAVYQRTRGAYEGRCPAAGGTSAGVGKIGSRSTLRRGVAFVQCSIWQGWARVFNLIGG